MVRFFRRAYGVILQVQMKKKVLTGRIYKSPNSAEKNTQELLKLMKSDLLNNYYKIYIVGNFNYLQLDGAVNDPTTRTTSLLNVSGMCF